MYIKMLLHDLLQMSGHCLRGLVNSIFNFRLSVSCTDVYINIIYILNISPCKIMTGSNIVCLTGGDKVSQHNWLDFNIDFTKNNT